jgi:hypothetical protein
MTKRTHHKGSFCKTRLTFAKTPIEKTKDFLRLALPIEQSKRASVSCRGAEKPLKKAPKETNHAASPVEQHPYAAFQRPGQDIR